MCKIQNNIPDKTDNSNNKSNHGGKQSMKATGIVRRIDELGRVVIPKEIRRTLRIREGDPSQITLHQNERFCAAMLALGARMGIEQEHDRAKQSIL